jgi:tRNA A-37 threonylcarbamoyl transferase component Bud32
LRGALHSGSNQNDSLQHNQTLFKIVTHVQIASHGGDSQVGHAQLDSHAEEAQFKHALNEWLLLHAGDATGVSFVDMAGCPCVVKRYKARWFAPLTARLQFVGVSALSWLCWLVLGERPSTRLLLKKTLQDEAQRLMFLKEAGSAVPSIWYQAPNVLVLEYVGQDLPYLIRIATPEGRLQLMTTAAQQLAQFHRAGFVHGGAQLRNLMMQEDGKVTRIDFEENIGEALSTPLAQAYDVFQMLSSMAGLRGHQFGPTERQALCQQLLAAYLSANDDPLVRASLAAIEKKFAALKKYLGWCLKWIPGRDVQGFLSVTNTLRVSLHDE